MNMFNVKETYEGFQLMNFIQLFISGTRKRFKILRLIISSVLFLKFHLDELLFLHER